jgi:hypothetical protein
MKIKINCHSEPKVKNLYKKRPFSRLGQVGLLGGIRVTLLTFATVSFFVFGEVCSGENRPDGSNLLRSPEFVEKEDTGPDKYTVTYSLKEIPVSNISKPGSGFSIFSSAQDDTIPETQAEIAVNILGPNFIPIRTFLLRNVTKVDNVVTLWDGLDMYGKEAPEGMYYASLSIIYTDGKKETKFFRFLKK